METSPFPAELCIASDAHSAASLIDFCYGVGIARKGWIEKGDVINCLDADGFLAFARAESGRAPARPGAAKKKRPRRASGKKRARKAGKKAPGQKKA